MTQKVEICHFYCLAQGWVCLLSSKVFHLGKHGTTRGTFPEKPSCHKGRLHILNVFSTLTTPDLFWWW